MCKYCCGMRAHLSDTNQKLHSISVTLTWLTDNEDIGQDEATVITGLSYFLDDIANKNDELIKLFEVKKHE